MARKIRTNDLVRVISGAHKGQQGVVLRVDPKKDRLYVQGVNVRSRNTKPSPANPEGGIVKKELSIHISNVSMIDPANGEQTTRVGFRFDEAGNKVRYAKASGQEINKVSMATVRA